MSPRARDIKERINKWDFIKIKSFCTAKENISKMKREWTIWENLFANDTLDKSLISKICKELIWLNTSKTNNPLKNGQGNLIETSARRTYRGPRDIWKDAQHLFGLYGQWYKVPRYRWSLQALTGSERMTRQLLTVVTANGIDHELTSSPLSF